MHGIDSSADWTRILYLCVLISACFRSLMPMKLPSVYWNSSNPMFKTSNNDHVIDVNLFDSIDFYCPYYSNTSHPDDREYYIIRMVSKEEYDNCHLQSGTSSSPVFLPCTNPVSGSSPTYRTLLFDRYSGIPNAPDFEAGGIYYFISTSLGTQDGLNNDHHGACFDRNMRLTIRVCCQSTSTSTANTTTSVWTSTSSHPAQSPHMPSSPASDSTTVSTVTTMYSSTTEHLQKSSSQSESSTQPTGIRVSSSTTPLQASTATRLSCNPAVLLVWGLACLLAIFQLPVVSNVCSAYSLAHRLPHILQT